MGKGQICIKSNTGEARSDLSEAAMTPRGGRTTFSGNKWYWKGQSLYKKIFKGSGRG